MSGPECDWCGAEGEDMDIYCVGGEFLCGDCCEIAGAGRELLAALKSLARMVECEYGGFDSIPEWQKAVAAINKAEGRGE